MRGFVEDEEAKEIEEVEEARELGDSSLRPE